MTFRDPLHDLRAHIQTLRIGVGALLLIIAILGVALKSSIDGIWVNIPPDLRSGAVVRAGDAPAESVYTFSFYILQQLYRWRTDGADDYSANIHRLGAFLTPSCRSELERDNAERSEQGELLYRVRSLQPVADSLFSNQRVQQVGSTRWKVTIDMELFETVRGQEVKRSVLRYPLRVVAHDDDREYNPWGLKLDCFERQPYRITEQGEGQ